MPIIALLCAFAAIAVFLLLARESDRVVSLPLGLALLTAAITLTYWTSWHNVHWVW